MPGVTLSRWTMAYFAAALASLMAALLLMAAGFGHPFAPPRDAETLVVVHLVTIGWLSLLMLGALFQFVPVLTTRPLHSDRAAGAALIGLLAGLAFLVAGFLRLAGRLDADMPFFPIAAVCLGAGFAVAIYALGRTFDPKAPVGLPARFVTAGLYSLAATVALGIVFACGFSGDVESALLLEVASAAVPVHAIVGLGGWLTFTAMGVSYRLLAMFMLAPEAERASTRWVYGLGATSLALAVLGGIVAILAGANLTAALGVSGVVGVVALALYGYDVVHLYRARLRRTVELNSRMAVFAFASLAAATLLAAVSTALGSFDAHVDAMVFLVAMGWLTGLGLAKLYKIVAFMTWLECYGPVLGKTPTPRVQDLVDERRAAPWFVGYFVSTWLAALALLASIPLAFQIAAVAMAIATAGIVVHYVRTRRLTDVAVSLRVPAGARRPHMFLCTPH